MTSEYKLSIRMFTPLCLLILLFAGALLLTEAAKSGAAQPPVIVKMLDAPPSFQPAQVTIKVGETVEWQNVGNEVHHATSDPSLAIKGADVTDPPGAKPFDSGFLKPGQSFSLTFSVPGTYRYTCVVHEAKGMTG